MHIIYEYGWTSWTRDYDSNRQKRITFVSWTNYITDLSNCWITTVLPVLTISPIMFPPVSYFTTSLSCYHSHMAVRTCWVRTTQNQLNVEPIIWRMHCVERKQAVDQYVLCRIIWTIEITVYDRYKECLENPWSTHFYMIWLNKDSTG